MLLVSQEKGAYGPVGNSLCQGTLVLVKVEALDLERMIDSVQTVFSFEVPPCHWRRNDERLSSDEIKSCKQTGLHCSNSTREENCRQNICEFE